jgi:lipopolysaccharide transport system permease protein
MPRTTPASELTRAAPGKHASRRGRPSRAGQASTDQNAAAGGVRRRIDSRRRWFPDLRELFHAGDLLVLLSRRQITVTYRQTVLGAAWIFVSPVLSAGLFTVVFGRIAHLSSGGTPYFVFSYAGLLGWNLFAATLAGAAGSLTANSALISKIYFSRLVLPLATLGATLIQLGISAVVMCGLLIAYGIGFSIHLLVLPVWLFLALVLGMGAGLILTAISVAYRDVNNVTPALIPLFLYLTPVAYPTADVPRSLRDVFLVNPVATVVEGCRWSLLGHGDLPVWAVLYTVVVTFGLLMVGLVVFARLEWSFADVI